jgi:hypothetical protein
MPVSTDGLAATAALGRRSDVCARKEAGCGHRWLIHPAGVARWSEWRMAEPRVAAGGNGASPPAPSDIKTPVHDADLLHRFPSACEGMLFTYRRSAWVSEPHAVKGSCMCQAGTVFVANLADYTCKVSTDRKRVEDGDTFVLEPVNPAQRPFMFSCPSKTDVATWVAALSLAAKSGSTREEDFDIICEVGNGAYGRVTLVRRRGTMALLAMKEIRKDIASALPRAPPETPEQHAARVHHKNIKNLHWLIGERTALQVVGQHPYITSLRYAFQSATSWFLVTDFVPGGDLFDHAYVQEQKRFPEETVRVWSAELVCALEHLQQCHIIHRDLKLVSARRFQRRPPRTRLRAHRKTSC